MVKYYTLEEVRFHNSADDCWVSISSTVFDITPLISANRGLLANPLIEAAGTSISHWFSDKTGDVKTYMDPARNIVMPHTPSGRFIHVPPPNPQDDSPAGMYICVCMCVYVHMCVCMCAHICVYVYV